MGRAGCFDVFMQDVMQEVAGVQRLTGILNGAVCWNIRLQHCDTIVRSRLNSLIVPKQQRTWFHGRPCAMKCRMLDSAVAQMHKHRADAGNVFRPVLSMLMA
jgi:hypothetical protein